MLIYVIFNLSCCYPTVKDMFVKMHLNEQNDALHVLCGCSECK